PFWRPPTASPPSTPRSTPRVLDGPPPLRKARPGPLLRGLLHNSADEVAEVLGRDAQAATDMYLDGGSEPPLCAAVRLGCDERVFEVLLGHGLDVNATDARGRSPLALLGAESAPQLPRPCRPAGAGAAAQRLEGRRVRIAAALLRAGAEAEVPL
ncbi:unnamed protein product, partial [Prorocentrum cordatum]